MILEGRPEMVIGLPLDRNASKTPLLYPGDGPGHPELVTGAQPVSIGVPDVPFVEKNHLRPVFGDNWIEGQIIFIDHFENVSSISPAKSLKNDERARLSDRL